MRARLYRGLDRAIGPDDGFDPCGCQSSRGSPEKRGLGEVREECAGTATTEQCAAWEYLAVGRKQRDGHRRHRWSPG